MRENEVSKNLIPALAKVIRDHRRLLITETEMKHPDFRSRYEMDRGEIEYTPHTRVYPPELPKLDRPNKHSTVVVNVVFFLGIFTGITITVASSILWIVFYGN
jgi:hypothetical protein